MSPQNASPAVCRKRAARGRSAARHATHGNAPTHTGNRPPRRTPTRARIHASLSASPLRRGTMPRGRTRLLAMLGLALFIVAAIAALTGGQALSVTVESITRAGDLALPDSLPWNLTLVNSTHPLPAQFTVDTAEMPGGELVDTRIAEPLGRMFDACREAGYAPFVRSGFRTRTEQEAILAEKIQAYEDEGLAPALARRAALDWVAQPGTSEHELGLAVDINDENGDQGMYDWLADHAHEYGFIQRYPPDKSAITGIAHEPWHYRYVGEEAAAEIWQQDLTLEEYLDEL